MSLLPSLLPARTVPAAPQSVLQVVTVSTGTTSCPGLPACPGWHSQPQPPLAAGCQQGPPRAGPSALGLSTATPGLPLRALRDSWCRYAGWCCYQRAWPHRAWHPTVQPCVAQHGFVWRGMAQHGLAQLGLACLSPAYLTRPGLA